MTGLLVFGVVALLGCFLLPEPFDYRVRRRVEAIRGRDLVCALRVRR